MILCDLGRGFIITLMGILYLNHQLSAWIILFSTTMLSILEAFRLPCGSALIPHIIKQENIEYGLSLSASLSSAMEIIGTACASVIIGFGGISLALFTDALTFYLSAFFISLIQLPKHIHLKQTQQATWQLLKEGFIYLSNSRKILAIILIATCLNALLVPYNALQSVLCVEVYNMGAEILSIHGICVTFGLLIGAFITPFISKKIKGRSLLCFGFFCCGGFYISLILTSIFKNQPLPFYLTTILTCIIFGSSVALLSTTTNVIMMKKIDPAYLSRITAVNSAIAVASIPIVSFIISGLTEILNVDAIFINFGILTLILGLLISLSPISKAFNEE